MEPVALSQLVKQAPEGAPFAAGADGTLEIRTALPCAAYPFFAPFPFFCLGCCHFRASALTFDDRTRRFQYRSWPGLLRCCARTGDFAYEDIGNVAFRASSLKICGERYFEAVVVLRNGQILETGRLAEQLVIAGWCVRLHEFIFGRGNPHYRRPQPLSLAI